MKIFKLLKDRLHVYPLYPHGGSPIQIPDAYKDRGDTKLFYVMGTAENVTEAKKGDWIICHSYTEGAYPIGDGSFIVNLKYVLAIVTGSPEAETYEKA